MEYRGSRRDRAKVQIGAELLWKGGEVGAEEDYRLQKTNYRVKVGAWLCRALVMIRRTRRSLAPTRGQSPRIEAARLVRSPNPTLGGVKRGTGNRDILQAGGGREVKLVFGRHLANGRDAVAPLPEAGERILALLEGLYENSSAG